VIAPAGNRHLGAAGETYTTVTAPAYARKVIGVGAFDFADPTGAPLVQQNAGPTADGRVKPDVMGPTTTETAGNTGPDQYFPYTLTSGAAPYVAGAAALMRNWLKWVGRVTDPGQVYAQLILAGRKPFPFESRSGAGPIELRPPGTVSFGKVSLIGGEHIDLPIGIAGSGTVRLEAAIWWPERLVTDAAGNRVDSHSDISLYLLDEDQNLRALSSGGQGVFGRAEADMQVHAPNGVWLRIRRAGLSDDPQTVYWAARAIGP
jgi:hypothetical protein